MLLKAKEEENFFKITPKIVFQGALSEKNFHAKLTQYFGNGMLVPTFIMVTH